MPINERISAVVSLTLIGLALYFVLEFPARITTLMLFGSPLTLYAPRQWLMAVLLTGLAMAGANTVVRDHPGLSDQRLNYLATFWMLPGLLVFFATQTLGLAPNAVTWAIALLGVGILLWLTLIAECHLALPGVSSGRSVRLNRPAPFSWARLWQQFMSYGLALGLFIAIYHPRFRGALSATSILLISGMLALPLLRHKPEAISRTWLFAVIIGLSLGQITWALNYWRVSTLHAGLLLLLVFYVLVGLAQQRLQGALSQRALWEFGLISFVALLVIFNL
jgi:hypothetical protein